MSESMTSSDDFPLPAAHANPGYLSRLAYQRLLSALDEEPKDLGRPAHPAPASTATAAASIRAVPSHPRATATRNRLHACRRPAATLCTDCAASDTTRSGERGPPGIRRPSG